MTFPQLATLLLLSGLLIVFATDRFRIELVALVGLAIGVVLGIVPFADAFDGFANPAVITVAEILLLAGLISRSSLMDSLTRRLARFARSELSVIALLTANIAWAPTGRIMASVERWSPDDPNEARWDR